MVCIYWPKGTVWVPESFPRQLWQQSTSVAATPAPEWRHNLCYVSRLYWVEWLVGTSSNKFADSAFNCCFAAVLAELGSSEYRWCLFNPAPPPVQWTVWLSLLLYIWGFNRQSPSYSRPYTHFEYCHKQDKCSGQWPIGWFMWATFRGRKYLGILYWGSGDTQIRWICKVVNRI